MIKDEEGKVKISEADLHPLFGSAAGEEMGPDSDLDLLVVKPGDYHKGCLTEEIYRHLIGVGQAVDVGVVSPDDIDRYRDSHPLVTKPALREGKVVYERSLAATSAADGRGEWLNRAKSEKEGMYLEDFCFDAQ